MSALTSPLVVHSEVSTAEKQWKESEYAVYQYTPNKYAAVAPNERNGRVL